MSESRNNGIGGCCSPSRETVAINTNRILDSCRDKDCYEDARVYLCPFGQEIIEKTNAVRVKSADIVWTYVGVEPVQFSRGFYTLYIRFYVRVVCEACVCAGKSQQVAGISVIEKKVILFGSEGNASIYKSDGNSNFCSLPPLHRKPETNLPVGVVEVVDPVVLGVKIVEPCHPCICCCCVDDIPEEISAAIEGTLVDDDDSRHLVVSLGFFSVCRIERPAQYLISATEYCLPSKECIQTQNDNPCNLFRSMSFPTSEFCPPSLSALSGNDDNGCRNKCNS